MLSTIILIAASALHLVSTLLDLQSSLACSKLRSRNPALHETSGLYASPDGSFGTRGMVLMLALTLGVSGTHAALYALSSPVQYGPAALAAGLSFWHLRGWRGNLALIQKAGK